VRLSRVEAINSRNFDACERRLILGGLCPGVSTRSIDDLIRAVGLIKVAKGSCNDSDYRGLSGLLRPDIPRLCRDTGPPSWRVLCSGLCFSEYRRESHRPPDSACSRPSTRAASGSWTSSSASPMRAEAHGSGKSKSFVPISPARSTSALNLSARTPEFAP
jgi:hypothetical protein